MNETKTCKPFALTERYIRAGTDPDTMLPLLIIEDLSCLGIDGIPDQRLTLSPEAARKVAAALLFAADPDLAVRMLERLCPPASARSIGSVSEVGSIRAGMLAQGSTEEGADWILGVGPKVQPNNQRIELDGISEHPPTVQLPEGRRLVREEGPSWLLMTPWGTEVMLTENHEGEFSVHVVEATQP